MRRPILAILLCLLATSAFAQKSPLDSYLSTVRSRTLPNGLTLITREVPGSGVVAINTWVKAGYFHEPDEVAGMAHLFEHMFFKGSKNFPGAEQISEELASVGGRSNAGTIYDTTNYYFVLPKEGFQRALDIQADAIANPLFDPAELKKESEVVIEESNRKYDNAPAVALERMIADSFSKHRIRRWRIGSNDVLRNIKRDNLLAFFETLYRPQNMVLVVVGDVTHDEAHKAVAASFGKLPKGTLKKQGGPAEPAQTEFRYGQSAADLRQGYTTIGWHTAGVGSADEIALNLLATIVGQGRSSRLFRNAIGPAAASTANAGHFTFEDVGLFFIQASFDEKNRAEVDRRLLREVERIKATGPSAYELQLAKNLNESQTILGLEDVLGQAGTLGEAETRGGFKNVGTDLAKAQAVTAEDIRRVARQYLTVEKMTLYHYRPKGAPESTREAALAAVKEAIAAPASVDAAPAMMPPAPQPLKPAKGASAPQVSKLGNGATLVVEERPNAPSVTVGIFFGGGRTAENSANAGITRLMTGAMRRGTASRAAEQIDREIEFLGTQLNSNASQDYFGFVFDVVSRNVRPATSLLADVVLNPTFPDKGIEEEKHLQKAAIKRNFDSATARPGQLMLEKLWGNHPYALPPDGYVTSVDPMNAAALRDWWKQNVVADEALIVVVGDVSAEDAKALVESEFGKLPRRAATMRAASQSIPLLPNSRSDAIEYRDRKQSAITAGFPAVNYSHADYVPLRMVQEVSSGLGGILFAELRGKRSLAYTVFGNIQSAGQGGTFVAYMATEAAKEPEAQKALIDELRRLGKDSVTDAILARGKSTLAGGMKLNRQNNSSRVFEYVRNHFFGLGLDWSDKFLAASQKLTLDDVRTAAQKYLGGDNYVVGVVRGK
jgi:zinc protease